MDFDYLDTNDDRYILFIKTFDKGAKILYQKEWRLKMEAVIGVYLLMIIISGVLVGVGVYVLLLIIKALKVYIKKNQGNDSN